ncbi:MAG: lysine--tRNA ligase [Pleurocapsa minor GSE-CHR-MK-17-07R]|jgi:lysyl-tRNA synthetase class 2|nr:lysine--tRNA ligase [Pleurocapsa minor GSE-CHR-MK 17-07R]
MWQPNRLEQERLDKLNEIEARGVSAFPARVKRTHEAAAAIAAFEWAESRAAGSEPAEVQVTVAGRIRRINVKGKISFMHIEDESGRVQLFLRINDMDEAQYALVADKLIDTDDFVQAEGVMMRTKAGEVSVRVTALTLLSKSLSPLPVIKQQVQDDGTVREYGQFTNTEARYRQRYADLAVNQGIRDTFVQRARIIRAIRSFMDSEGCLEVETPILQPLYGGAAARPFITHHNQLDEDLYLRVSFELYLKRLLVGGFSGVYELGRDFRNEGVSWKHNPEFTMLEFYKAYIDYHGVMDMTERMVCAAVEAVHGSRQAPFKDYVIDYTPGWKRLTMREAIKAETGIDYMDFLDRDALEARIRQMNPHDLAPGQPWGKLVEYLLGEYVEKKLIQPTFIIDYPRDISPFAKRVSYDDFHVERFEFYIAGMEMGNAFTELNDPRDQEARFLDMARTFRPEDDDAAPIDQDYLRAMRYGMPPNGGFGMGIDRLVMLITNQDSIRDVLLYPALKQLKDEGEGESAAEEAPDA